MRDLTKGNIFKNFIFFSVPLILSGMLSVAFHITDLIIVSHCLGEHGLAAVGSTATFVEIISSIMWGLGTGASIYLATLFGARNYKELVNSIKISIISMAVLALFIAVMVILFHRPLFNILRIGSEIHRDAWLYLGLYFLGFIFLGVNWLCGYIFNAMGNPSFPLKLSAISFIGNIAGNLLFIEVFGWGVAGAAAATILFAVITTIFYLLKLKKEFEGMGCKGQKLMFNKRTLINTCHLGFPNMTQQFLMYLASASVQPLINGIGSAAIAGYAASMKIYSLNSTIFQSSSKALLNYNAQCIGAGKTDQIKKGLKVSVIQVFLFTLPVAIACLMFPRQIAGIFFTDAFGEGANYTVEYIKFCIPFLVFQVLDNMFHNFYRGVLMIPVIVVSTAVNTAVRIGLSYTLTPFFGMRGIYMALVISWMAEAAVVAGIYFSGTWEKRNAKIV